MSTPSAAEKVSIVINNYNYRDMVGRAIQSALDQDYPHVEVIVVDDGSTDGSQDVIRTYADRITFVEKENGGQASCFNSGFRASTGGIICMLDSDDEFLLGKISRIKAIFDSNPQAGWVFHSLYKKRGSETGSDILKNPGPIDLRRSYVTGWVNAGFPATSAICFRRELLDRFLPMPIAPGVQIGDHYLKYAAAALAPGVRSDERLAIQYLHGDNAYTSAKARETQIRIYTLTAYALRQHINGSTGFADNLIGTAMALSGSDFRAEFRDYIAGSSLLGKLRVRVWQLVKMAKLKAGKRLSGG